jgi:hypothetical protein
MAAPAAALALTEVLATAPPALVVAPFGAALGELLAPPPQAAKVAPKMPTSVSWASLYMDCLLLEPFQHTRPPCATCPRQTYNAAGLDTSTLSLVALTAAVLALVWLVILQLRTSRMLGRYQQLLSGVEAGNLEEIMSMHVGRINQHDRRLGDVDRGLDALDRVLQTVIQRVGLVRFNPFDEVGGDQSFAIALLDQHGNGFVLSSLHHRTETRVYAKPIEGGRSRYALSDEEEQALTEANAKETRAAS